MNAGDQGLGRTGDGKQGAGSRGAGKPSGNSRHDATAIPEVMTVLGRIPIIRRGTVPDGTVLGGPVLGGPVLGGIVLSGIVLSDTVLGATLSDGTVPAEMARTRLPMTSRAGQPRRDEIGGVPGGRR